MEGVITVGHFGTLVRDRVAVALLEMPVLVLLSDTRRNECALGLEIKGAATLLMYCLPEEREIPFILQTYDDNIFQRFLC